MSDWDDYFSDSPKRKGGSSGARKPKRQKRDDAPPSREDEAEEVPHEEAEREDRGDGPPQGPPAPPGGPPGGLDLAPMTVPCRLNPDDYFDDVAEMARIRERLRKRDDFNPEDNNEDPVPLWDEGKYDEGKFLSMDPDYCAGCVADESEMKSEVLQQMVDAFYRDIWRMSWKSACTNLSLYYGRELRRLPPFDGRNYVPAQVSIHYRRHAKTPEIITLQLLQQTSRIAENLEKEEGRQEVGDPSKRYVNRDTLSHIAKWQKETRENLASAAKFGFGRFKIK